MAPEFFFLQMEKKKQESTGNIEISDFPQAQVKHSQLGKVISGTHAYSLVEF